MNTKVYFFCKDTHDKTKFGTQREVKRFEEYIQAMFYDKLN